MKRWMMLVPVLTVGCALQMKAGGPFGAPKGSPGHEASHEGSAPAGAANDGNDEETVVAYFKSYDYTKTKPAIDQGPGWYFGNVIKVSPLFHPYKMESPDPQWLPRWELEQKQRLDDRSYAALGQAAVNRTWNAACDADFADYQAKWKALDAKYRPELAKLVKEKNPYVQLGGLAALRKKLVEAATAEKALLPDEHPMRWSGLYFDVVSATFDAYRAQRRGFMLRSFAYDANVERLRAVGRARWESERDAFCGFAMGAGTHRTIPLPSLSNSPALAWPVAPTTRKELKATLAKTRPEVTARFDFAALDPPGLFSGIAPKAPEPKLVKLDRIEVVAASGNKVQLQKIRHTSQAYDCHTTKKIARIRPDGTVEYDMECKSANDEHRNDIKLTLDAVPPGLSLQKGDELTALVDIDAEKHKTLVETKERVVTQNDWTMTARHVVSVRRAGKVIATY